MYGLFAIGDAVEIFSESQNVWVKGAVIEVKVQKVAVEYGDRTRVVDLTDPAVAEYFRSEKLQQGLGSGSDTSEMSKQSDGLGSKQGGGGLSAILRQDPNSAFAIAQQRLRAKKEEITDLKNTGFRGAVDKAVERAKQEAVTVASDFWAPKPRAKTPTDGVPELALTAKTAGGDEDEVVATKSEDIRSDSYSTDDPVLANAKSLLAAMPDLDALQASLLSRTAPSVFHSDSEDDELTADAGSRPVSREQSNLAVVLTRKGNRVRDIHVPNEAQVAAKAAMAEQRSQVSHLLIYQSPACLTKDCH